MSMSCSAEGINEEDQRIFRLFKITMTECRKGLHYVFTWGCKRAKNESMKDYLKNVRHLSGKDYHNRFDKTMREAMEKDPSGVNYDVSLLWACIKWGCVDLATNDKNAWMEGNDTKVESLCTTVKQYRNGLCHGTSIPDDETMNIRCNDMKDKLEKLLRRAGALYKVDSDEIENLVKQTLKNIKIIMDAPLANIDPWKVHEEMLKFREELKSTINEQGKAELSERYKNISKIDPASFVTGKERLHVKNVFTKLEVVCEKMDDTYDISYNELLELNTDGEPTVIIVEGDAGAGKTTLTKLILSDWADGAKIFKGLEEYDLVLRAEGRNKYISSFLDLIQVLIPTAYYKFTAEDLLRSVLKLKVLLVMDGFDELNEASERLLRELSDMQIDKSGGSLQLLVTTRPSKFSDLVNLVSKHSHVQTKLKGISINKRVEFVSKLHDEMRKEGQSEQETQKLIDLMKQSQSRLSDHYRLPLNLTLLTYLWSSDPETVNPDTTATGLYIGYQELIQSRLLARLLNLSGITSLPREKCKQGIKEFLQVFYGICQDTLLSGFMQLSEKSVEKLKNKCEEIKLPFDELCEAFLAVEKEWTPSGYKTDLTVPHKSIMEFYAANKIMREIQSSEPSLMKELESLQERYNLPEEKRQNLFKTFCANHEPKSLKNICAELTTTTSDLEKYENVFLHLCGLLAYHCPDTLEEYSEELVDTLNSPGHRGTRWLDLLVESKCDDKMAKLLAPLSSYHLTVKDGHTGAALTLFKYLEENTPVRIILDNEVCYIPHLDEMLKQLSKRQCAVELHLRHQWKHREYGFSDDLLKCLLKEDETHQCRVNRFTGHLESLSSLPLDLQWVRITFANSEHAKRISKELQTLVQYVNYIGIHVMSEVKPQDLLTLPVVKPKNKECGTLWLSNVGKDWEEKCNVIRALLPEGGMYNSIMFPGSNFSRARCIELINKLHQLKIKVEKKAGVRVSSSIMSKQELFEVKAFTRKTLDCEFYCVEESSMW